MEMSETKQHIFMQRVLFSYDITKKRAGKAQILRIPMAQWEQEADICCLGGEILEKMRTFRDPSNLTVFPIETIAATLTRLIEGSLDTKTFCVSDLFSKNV